MNYSHFVKCQSRFNRKSSTLCIHESALYRWPEEHTIRSQVCSMSKISESNQSKFINIFYIYNNIYIV